MLSPSDQLARERSEAVFDDKKKPLSAKRAIAEANRCLYCYDAPCIQGCPTRIDIPEFIRRIATDNIKAAARTILRSNILGMSCARVCPVEVLCASKCVLLEMGAPPIQIGKLQRYATDAAVSQQWCLFEPAADSGKSVGLVGCGPASLAAAHALRRQGHACTIYERRNVAGGLNTWGIAPYKIKADSALREIDYVLSIGGVKIETDVTVGQDVTWDELVSRHDALFIGVGIGGDKHLGVPGEELPGVHGALEFIERMKLDRVDTAGVHTAVVVGGGNTAIDCVRELLGLGVPRVSLVYRRSRRDKPGYEHEWQEAAAEGARAEWRSLPIACEGQGRVERVRCVRVTASCAPIDGSTFELEADLVLVAIGQTKLGEELATLGGIRIERGCIVVDEGGRTGRPGVFAGGDCVNGGKEVVNAVAEGTAAAKSIDAFLRGESHA